VARSDEYAAALDQLEQMRSAGQVTQGEYDVKRAQLIAEASEVQQSPGRILLRLVGLVVVVLVLLTLLSVVIRLTS
jgi:hypothetical protein